jgi:hypothetical protein
MHNLTAGLGPRQCSLDDPMRASLFAALQEYK